MLAQMVINTAKQYNHNTKRLEVWLYERNIDILLLDDVKEWFIKITQDYAPSTLSTIRSHIQIFLVYTY